MTQTNRVQLEFSIKWMEENPELYLDNVYDFGKKYAAGWDKSCHRVGNQYILVAVREGEPDADKVLI